MNWSRIVEPLIAVSLLVIPVVIVWGLSVADLMSRSDDEFPGRSDKLAWAILLAITGIFGTIVWLCKRPRFRDSSELSAVVSSTRRTENTDRDSLTCLQCGAGMSADSSTCSNCGWSYDGS